MEKTGKLNTEEAFCECGKKGVRVYKKGDETSERVVLCEECAKKEDSSIYEKVADNDGVGLTPVF